jgi:NADPH:quinone reductase-like Zn-dependent oxidoreductase
MEVDAMRAVLLTGFGDPGVLVYRDDVPEPKPASYEVRVRVGAAGINNTDIWTRQGAYGSPGDPQALNGWRRTWFQFPRIQGADVVGRIDGVGSGVSSDVIGQRVLVDPMLYSGSERELVATGYLGSERDGGFAEWVTVPAVNAHRVDSSLTDAELSTFPTAYATALRMIGRVALEPGETVLVTGASGGVGTAVIQLAKLAGATVVALSSAGRAERLRELGADLVLLRESHTDLGEAIGAKVDVVADVVGGPGFGALLRVLRPLGRYVVAGAIAGPLVETDLRTIYLNQLTLLGSSFGTHEDFAAIMGFIAEERLQPVLERTYPLRELATAQADFVAKRFFGKLAVIP